MVLGVLFPPWRKPQPEPIEPNVEDEYADERQRSEVMIVSPLRQLLDAVNMSILPHDLRLQSIAQACDFFDHRDRMMHDSELREGAAYILYQKLSFALSMSLTHENDPSTLPAGSSTGVGAGTSVAGGLGMSTMGGGMGEDGGGYDYGGVDARTSHRLRGTTGGSTDADHEIAMITSCLEMVHRASSDAIASVWYEIGEDILPLMVDVLERPFRRMEAAAAAVAREAEELTKKSGGTVKIPPKTDRVMNSVVNRDQKLAVQKITKLLAMYSLVPEAKKPMAHCPGMLPVLVKIIDTHNLNRVRPPKRDGRGGTGGGGGGGSSGKSVGGMASSVPGGAEGGAAAAGASASARGGAAAGVNGVRAASSGAGLNMTEAARFNTIATLTNLAAAEENRMTMLAQPGLVDNVARVVRNERSDVARQCSALAIMNLSNGDREHVPEMASNELLLDTLVTLMKDDMPETRRNAAVALFNVACADENTIRLARYRDGIILEALVEIVASDDPSHSNDEARVNAAETLFNMSCSEVRETTDRIANHSGLLESIAVTLKSTNATIDVKMYCAATLRRMAEIIRAPMISQGALLSALVKASAWTRTACVAEAFRVQADLDANRRIMAEHHGLLNALSRLALTVGGEESDRVRSAAVSAIEKLSREESARPLLAHNEGIMMALTRASYGSSGGQHGGGGGGGGGGGTSVAGGSQFEREYYDENDDASSVMSQGRLVQMALKNLVAAM